MPDWARFSAQKGLGLACAAGATSGIVILSVISGGGIGMVLAYVTPLPLLLIGLAFGLGACLAASAVGALVVAVAGMAAVPAFVVIGAFPALLLSAAALRRRVDIDGVARWSETGELLMAMAFGAVLVMGLVCLALPTEGQSIEVWLKSQAEPMVESGLPNATPEVKAAIVGLWIAVMPAMVGAAWFVMTMINGVIAQWAVSQAGHALRPAPSYGRMRLPRWLAAAAALAGGLSLIGGDGGYLARNMAILLLLPFLLAGVADLHGILRRRPYGGLWLGLFYGVFFALFGWAALPVTLWGLVTQFGRSRRQDTAQDQEDRNGSDSA